MRYSRLLLLALPLALAACGDAAGGGPQLGPKDFALVKVSGDQQTDTVALGGGASAQVATVAGVRALTTPEGEQILPDPLVVKVTPKGGGSFDRAPLSGASDLGPTGPDLQAAGVLPTVTWKVVEDGCGEPFTLAGQPDPVDSTVATFVVRGTHAGTCHVRAQTVQRDSAGNLVPIVQQEFTYTLLPGPLAFLRMYFPESPSGTPRYANVGDTIDLRDFVATPQDANGNALAVEDARALPDSVVHSGWRDASCNPCVSVTDYADAATRGWRVVVPDTAGMGRNYEGVYTLLLTAYIDGVDEADGSPRAYTFGYKIMP